MRKKLIEFENLGQVQGPGHFFTRPTLVSCKVGGNLIFNISSTVGECAEESLRSRTTCLPINLSLHEYGGGIPTPMFFAIFSI